ncbi:MAG: hypothetical protein HYU51_06195 [Candidatus Rokubacteria bacterium]|nr:hypothetical protein [Candidatus Rokubacteria bacterium]
MIGRLLVACLAVAALAAPGMAVEPETCTTCHTDESRLKSLFVPPKTGGGEGEG